MAQRPLLLALLTLLAGSCIDAAVPAGVVLHCADDAECPDKFICRKQIGVCVSAAALDSEPPTVADVAIADPLVRADEDIVVTFKVSEPLFEDPDVELGFSDRARPAVVAVAGLAVTATYHTRGDEPEGAVAITASLVDVAGNVAANVALTSATLDFTPPVVVDVSAAPGLAKSGVDVAVRVQTSEPLDPASTLAVVGGRALALDGVDPGDPLVSLFHLSVDGALDAAGSAALSVVAVDAAGNSSNKTVDDAFTLDFAAPVVTPQPAAGPAAVLPGGTIVVTFLSDEPLASSSVVLVDAAGNEQPVGALQRTGLVYIASRPVEPSDADGDYEVRLASWSDAAGNDGDGPLLLDHVTIDGNAPEFTTAPSTDVTHVSRQLGRDTVVLSFTLSESADIAARLGGRPLACVETPSGAGVAYTCSYSVVAEDVDGVADVTVTATDAAGNTRFAAAPPVVFDFTAPSIASASVSPVLAARPGDNVVVSVVADEPLALAPSLTVGGPGGAPVPPGFFADLGGTFVHGVVESDSEGVYTTAIDLVDLAGNAATGIAGPTFALDVSTPLVVTSSVSPGFAKAGADVSLAVHVSEPVGTAPPGFVATIGGRPFDSCVENGSPVDVLCTYVVRGPGPDAEAEGVTAISVVARDTAGNTGFSGASVVLDFTAPALASATVSPALSHPGDNVVLAFVADEPLAQAPRLAVAGPAALAFTADGGTFSHAVTAGDAEGTFTSAVALEDLAGNIAAAVAGPSFALDVTAPTVVSVTAAPAFASLAAGHDVVTVALVLAEPVDVAAGGLVVGVGGRAATCSADALDPRSVACTYAVVGDEPEGDAPISVLARDAAGNTDFGSASVVFDFTPPSLASATASPALARPGDNVVVSVAADEALGAPPLLTAAGPGTATFVRLGNTFTHAVTGGGGGDVEGAYTTRLDLVDLAGNSATLAGPSFALDLSSPRVVDLVVSPAAVSTVSGNDVVTIDLLLSEALAPAAPNVVVTVAGNDAPCLASGSDPLSLECLYGVTGGEPEGDGAVAIALRDDAGNTGFASDGVVFDFTPPSVLAGSVGVTLTPGAGNVLTAVTAVTTGTRVNVSFTLSEPTASTSVATTAPAVLAFAQRAQAGTTFLFDHVLASATQGSYTVAVTASDLVGNRSTTQLALPAPGFVVDTLPPTAPTTSVADAIVYTRVPFGSDATAGARSFVVTAAPGMIDGTTAIAYDSVRAEIGRAVVGAASGGGTSITLSGSDRGEVFLSAVDDAGNESDDGAAAGLQATRVRDVTWVAGYGDKLAGSLLENPHVFQRHRFSPDDLVALGATEAAATDGITRAGGGRVTDTGAPTFIRAGGLDSPLGRRQPGFAYDSARHRSVMFGGDGTKSDTWEWDGYNWAEVLPTDAEGDGRPAPRDGVRLVYDPVREKTIFIGGIRFFPAGLDETWEWNGQSWNRRCDGAPATDVCTLPPARQNHGLVFDARRGVVVLFGGAGDINNGSPKNDTWEWNGVTWTQRCDGVPATDVCGTLPPPRQGLSLGYNDATGKVVMFGGANGGTNFDDTWEYDGTTWRDISSTPRPSARQGAEMAFDPVRGELLLFGGGTVDSRTAGGGLNDVFSHDGTRWLPIAVTDPEADGTPQGRRFMGMTTADDEIQIMGGQSNGNCDLTGTACGGVWKWNSATASFSDQIPDLAADNGPGKRDRPVMAYDSRRERTVMFGGVDVGVGPANETCRGEAGNASFSARCGFTWEWNGVRWTKVAGVVAGSTPDARVDHAMAYDRNRGVVVLFGGTADGACEASGSSFCPGTWEWNGAVWSKKAPATNPTPRQRHTMAFDEARGVVVMFGGQTQGNAACDGLVDCSTMWTWNGTNWVAVAQGNIGDGVPLARERAAMAWDNARQEVLLFGGLRDNLPGGTACNEGFFGVCDDTWSWNGTRWDKLATAGPGSTSTGPTRNLNMVFDRRRNRTVIIGGNDNNFGRPEDSFEFDGSTWTTRTIADPEGDGTPPGRVAVGLAFDELYGVVVSFGSLFNDDGTWLWDGGASQSAGHHMSYSFRSAGAAANTAATTIVSLSANLIVGATGGTGASTTQGAELSAWDAGQWRVVAVNTAPSTTPAPLPFATTDPLFLGRIFAGADRSLRLAVRSSGNAQVTAPSSVTTDLAEVTVRYRLP